MADKSQYFLCAECRADFEPSGLADGSGQNEWNREQNELAYYLVTERECDECVALAVRSGVISWD